MSMAGKFGSAAVFAMIFVYTGEMFPTSIRSLGIGLCSTAARISSTLFPFVVGLVRTIIIRCI